MGKTLGDRLFERSHRARRPIDVRNALQAMQSTELRLDDAIAVRHYAEEQYASEQRQFQAGTSTVLPRNHAKFWGRAQNLLVNSP